MGALNLDPLGMGRLGQCPNFGQHGFLQGAPAQLCQNQMRDEQDALMMAFINAPGEEAVDIATLILKDAHATFADRNRCLDLLQPVGKIEAWVTEMSKRKGAGCGMQLQSPSLEERPFPIFVLRLVHDFMRR